MSTPLDEFLQTIAKLRGPNGCPWDKEQDHQSLARYLLEETYEVLETIHLSDVQKLKEELGDLLLQIVLHAQIAKDNKDFDIQDVAAGINAKMINRHPHVFANVNLETSGQVKQQWEELKAKEKKSTSISGIDSIPKTMPALLQALKISEKAVHQGFEWENIDQIWDQLHSEIDELKEAIASEKSANKRREIDLELGDVFFTLVNIARWNNLNPEESLLLANEKFKQRFTKMEQLSEKPLKELSKTEFESLWCKAKLELSSTR